ncbi:hypothetical protein SAMN05216511_5944 [Streptomyces sp. KS_16]|nr:hypothetical protein BX261_1272 [Streptomyces sp. 2321.6]SDR55200.1 hypothetical protein SAMN05216511_5944 [Streptomyces sp. KS_16]SEC13540.1 hypothetical protein SAMN05428940_1272 [Streptomyces sp. 2133.1]SNC65205.1 hypothetical protein SAMN06272741_1270 [Streptomyces sp. 2114.4]
MQSMPKPHTMKPHPLKEPAMHRRTRTRIAVASTLPTLLAVAACGVLAATGALAWQIPCAGLVALVFQGVLTDVRLGRGPAAGRS